MAAPITFTGLFRWIIILFVVSSMVFGYVTHLVRRDITRAHQETALLSYNMAMFAKYQTELREANASLVAQRDALSFYTLHLVKENDSLYKDNEMLFEWFKKLRDNSRQ
jgi:hypothetical protein